MSDFTYKIIECSKQKLASCAISIIPNLHARFLQKNVSDKDKAVHIKCNNLNYSNYRYLQNSNKYWCCIESCSTIFPFNSLSSNRNFLACCMGTDNNTTQWIYLDNDHAAHYH